MPHYYQRKIVRLSKEDSKTSASCFLLSLNFREPILKLFCFSYVVISTLSTYPHFVPTRFTCLCVLLALCAFVPYVPIRASFFPCLSNYVLTYLYIVFVFTCLCALYYFVLTCAHFSRVYVPKTTHKINRGSSLLLLVLLFFSGLFDVSLHSKPQKELLLLKLHNSVLACRVLVSQLVHAQRELFDDLLRNYLKQRTLSSISNS